MYVERLVRRKPASKANGRSDLDIRPVSTGQLQLRRQGCRSEGPKHQNRTGNKRGIGRVGSIDHEGASLDHNLITDSLLIPLQ